MLFKRSILLSLLALAPLARAEPFVDRLAPPSNNSSTNSKLRSSPPPNPNPDLGMLAFSGTVYLLNTIGNGLADPARRQRVHDLSSQAPVKESYGARSRNGSVALRHETPDIYALRSVAGLDVQKVIKSQAKNIPQVVAVVKMAKVEIKPGSMFTSEPTPNAALDPLRYGLVVNSITPDPSSPPLASLGDSMDDLRFAGRAKVEWGVEPLTETNRRRLFQDVASDSPQPTAEDSAYSLRLPSPNFSTSATTEGGDDVTKVDARALPSLRFELSQEDGYYTLSYRTSGKGKKIGAEHVIKAPIVGTLKMGRRFDDHLRLLETSAYEILCAPHLPSLNVHQMHIERRYTADLSTRLGVSHSIGVTARGEAQGPVAQSADRPRAYGINYSHSF